MSEHLTRAARARHDETMKRATTALLTMAKAGERITFAAVGHRAGVSTDILYGTPTLRSQITDLREQPSASSPSPTRSTRAESTTAIRALSAQLKTTAAVTWRGDPGPAGGLGRSTRREPRTPTALGTARRLTPPIRPS